MSVLRFGDRRPDLKYRIRATAFGVVVNDEGKVACVRVDRGEGSYFDLPGGAIDGEETEAEALIREFREETGLTIKPIARIAEAAQAHLKSNGEPVENKGGFWIAETVSYDPSSKIEDDHELVWLKPKKAIARLRHDAHAWAVAKWLRS